MPVKDSFWSIVATVLPALFVIISTGVISRYLSDEEFVSYLYILSFLVYLMFFDLGFSKTLTYFLSKNKPINSQKGIITNVIFFGTILSVILILLVLFPIVIYYVPKVMNGNGLRIWPIYFSLVILFLFSVIQQFLMAIPEGNGFFYLLAKYRIIAGFVSSFIPLVTSIIAADFYLVVSSLALSKVLSCIIIFVSGKYIRLISLRCISWKYLKRIFNYSKGIYLSGLIAPVLGSGDKVVVASPNFYLHSVVYIPVVEMVTKLMMIPSALCKVVFVRAASSENGYYESKKLVYPYYFLIIIITVLYLIFLKTIQCHLNSKKHIYL